MKLDALPPNHQWVQRLRLVNFDYHEAPPWSDVRDALQVATKVNADAIRWPTIAWAVGYFGSSTLPQHPAAKGRDLLREMLEAAPERVRVIPYNHLGVVHTAAYEAHPEWVARDRTDKATRWQNVHYHACMWNPDYQQAYLTAIREVVERHPVPAMYFDGPAWYVRCFCGHCRTAFREAWGHELPSEAEWNPVSARRYQDLRERAIVEMARSIRSSIRAVRDIPVMFNTNMMHAHGWRSASMPELLVDHASGYLASEVHRAPDRADGAFLGILETVKLGASLKRVALGYFPPGPYETLVSHDTADTPLFGMLYLAHKATPLLSTARAMMNDDTGAPAVRKIFELSERNSREFYEAEAVPHALLAYSRDTARMEPVERIRDRADAYYSGAFAALSHDHQQFTCLYDRFLDGDNFGNAKVLVLPNMRCLADEQVAAIERFVRAGGGLVATGETSLYDAGGAKRDDFALRELFGVSYRSTCEEADYDGLQHREGRRYGAYRLVTESYLRPAADHPVLRGLKPGRLVPLSEGWLTGSHKDPPDYVLTEPLDGERIADLFLPAGGEFGEPFEFPYRTPPGVVARTHGEGRVVYVAAGLFRHYLRRGYRELRDLIGGAVDWAAGRPRPFTLDAPSTVVAHLTELPDTRFLHLINYTGAMYETAAYRAESIGALRDVDVSIAVPIARKAVSVTRLEDGLKLAADASNAGWVRVRVPELREYATIVVRLG